jgi:hypothetical protein
VLAIDAGLSIHRCVDPWPAYSAWVFGGRWSRIGAASRSGRLDSSSRRRRCGQSGQRSAGVHLAVDLSAISHTLMLANVRTHLEQQAHFGEKEQSGRDRTVIA